MELKLVKPRIFINALLSKKSIAENDFKRFKAVLEAYAQKAMQQHAEKQSEPNIVSNALKPFFEALGYDSRVHSQTGQSGMDLALFKDGRPAVIIEAKKPAANDMISAGNLNKKAFHEAVLYFMREREKNNESIFHIIITDFYNWYVFDAKDFDRLFWRDGTINKIFKAHSNPSLLGDTTKEFYEYLEREIPKFKSDLLTSEKLECAYFNIGHLDSEKDLLAVFKLLSPNSLFKEFNPNDANSLNREFYSELLYILGLEETNDKGKRLIGRAKNPQQGSMYENTLNKLTQYSKPGDFESVIKLLIIWVNRILFLKLLESQIVGWNENAGFRFLNSSKIDSYDKLETLFFDVLAKQPSDRSNRNFDYIPYLNSSLFETHKDEKDGITIATLSDDVMVDYSSKTVIKDASGKRKTGKVSSLLYLFEFLDAYDFSSEGGDELATESKSLISASVLGLIFEKINGYKDGSYYTPSFVTMYMAKETIEKSVIQKFNEANSWQCNSLTDLHNKIEDISQANQIINSLKICDPAVGSGHFLVSALNEVLRIKSELGVLTDDAGRKIKDYSLSVENDELIIKSDDGGDFFEYKKNSQERTRIQKTLFLEKQRIIENCLFGVDINPNSVNICRLRLWVELLKSAYYKPDGALDTLPNIDINIKCGNSLVSRFGLKDDLKSKSIKAEISDYKAKVKQYKENIGSKKDVAAAIEAIKSKFNQTLSAKLKSVKELNAALNKYVTYFGSDGLSDELSYKAFKSGFKQQNELFASASDKSEQKQLLEKISGLMADLKEIESGKIYENAFEWRFEFPEILDEDGNFDGFDIVIGNPPYFNIDVFGAGSPMLRYIPEKYPQVYMDKSDILFYFLSLATDITKSQTAFIISNAMLFSSKAKLLRNHLLDNNPVDKIINFEKFQVFDEASITAMMIFLDKSHVANARFMNFPEDNYSKNELLSEFDRTDKYIDLKFNKDEVFALVNDTSAKLNKKIDGSFRKLGELMHVGSGMQTAANKVFCFDQYPSQFPENLIKMRMEGEVIEKYTHRKSSEYLIYFEEHDSFEDLPVSIQKHLLQYRAELEKRATVKNEGRAWWRYSRPMHKDYYKFPKLWCSYRAKDNVFCLDESSDYIGFTNTTAVFATNPNIDIKYVLALLNSKTLNFRYKSIGKQTGSGVFEYFENQISKLPIPEISKDQQEPFVDKVDEIIKLKKSGSSSASLEQELDQMVYAVYGLDENDIQIINAGIGG